jgi:hypothetical protein
VRPNSRPALGAVLSAMPPLRECASWTPQTFGDYISQCMRKGSAVTINLGIYQDRAVDPRTVDVLKGVQQRIRKEHPWAERFDGERTFRFEFTADSRPG